MKKRAAILFAALAFNVIFFPFHKDTFGQLIIPNLGTLGFLFFVVGFIVFQFIAYYDQAETAKNKIIIPLAGIAILMATLAVFRASDVDIAIFNLLSLLAAGLCFYQFSLPKGRTIKSLVEVVSSPFAVLKESFVSLSRGMKSMRSSRKIPSKQINLTFIFPILGIIVGLPLVLVIISLLSHADPIFSKFVAGVFKFKDFPWWAVRGSISRAILTGLFCLGAISLAFTTITKEFKSKNQVVDQNRNSSLVVLSVVLMVAVVLAVYVVVDFPYLFAHVPETQLSQFGINTLSEYVTKGFGELIVVSVIVYITSAFSLFVYNLGGKGARYLRLSTTVVLAETVVFIGSIFRRVSIYQLEHGLTRSRIYGSILLAGLILWTLILMARYWTKSTRAFWYDLTVLGVLALTIFFVRPDYIIANDFQPTVNKEVDYVQIARLSPEAVDGWIAGYNASKAYFASTSTTNLSTADYETQRKAYYAFLTLNILRKNIRSLTLKYGDAQDLANIKATYGRANPVLPDIKNLNFVERLAFNKFKKSVDITELVKLEEQAYNLIYGREKIVGSDGSVSYKFNNKGVTITSFDRSLQSPLMQSVRVTSFSQ